jgi:hypothetical protein
MHFKIFNVFSERFEAGIKNGIYDNISAYAVRNYRAKKFK